MDTIHFAAIASSLHLIALGIGLPSIFLRSRALAGPLDQAGISRVLTADSIWGVAALLWIVDQHRLAAGVRRAREGHPVLSEFTAFLGQDGFTCRDLAPRDLAHDHVHQMENRAGPRCCSRHLSTG
jgi:hypothetical protein